MNIQAIFVALIALSSIGGLGVFGAALEGAIVARVRPDNGGRPRVGSRSEAGLSPFRALGEFADLSAAAPHDQTRIALRVPATTPHSDALFLAGDFNDWSAGDAAYRLERIGRDLYGALTEGDAPVAFKVTRGSWDTVETEVDGFGVANRHVQFQRGQNLALNVAAWHDQINGAAQSSVQRLSNPSLLDGRGLWRYAPAGFGQDARRYPALLLFDGQNLFETGSLGQSWELKKTLDALIADGSIPPLVVVGVEHAGEARMREYNPWSDAHHLARITQEVPPWLAREAQVDLNEISLGGSSLGGLMTLHGAFAYASHYRHFASLSPSLFFHDYQIMRDFERSRASIRGRIWMDIGVRERDGNAHIQTYPNLQSIGQGLLRNEQIDANHLAVRLIEDAKDAPADHSEKAWAHRIGDVLRFLYAGD